MLRQIKYSGDSPSYKLKDRMMNNNKGFSLIELMVVIAIVGIITSMAVPAFSKMMERNRLKTAVQSLQDDLQFARVQAIKKSQDVIINRTQTSSAAGDWCYGLSASACVCTVTDTTDANYCEIKRVSGTGFSTVSMFSASGNSTFDFRRGTIGANGVTFNTTNYAARVVFSDTGRARICAPTTYPSGITMTLPDLKC